MDIIATDVDHCSAVVVVLVVYDDVVDLFVVLATVGLTSPSLDRSILEL